MLNSKVNPPVIETHGSDCLLKADFTGGNYQKLVPTSWPGFAKWKDGTRFLIFRPTPNNIRYINESWPDVVWAADAKYHLDNFITDQIKAAGLEAAKKTILEDDGSYQYKHKPFDHQRQAFLTSRDADIYAYFMEQGTGKSKLTVDVGAYNYSTGRIEAMIVIAQNGVHTNWVDIEIPEHIPDWCPYKSFVYSANMTKAKWKELEEVIAAPNCFKIFAFNIEGFTSDKAREILERLILTFKCIIVVDESDQIKNYTSKRTTYLTAACDGVAMKRILTGTEITKGLEDLFGQLNFLGTKVLGYDNITSFKNHFCTLGGFKCRQVVGYKNVDELLRLLEPYSFRALKDDCLDLPPKMYKRWTVELSPAQRKLYDDLARNFFADCDGKQISASIGIVRLIRLQQITCGWFPADGETDYTRIPGDNPKLEAVLQHCKHRQKKTIVWARFKQDVKDITEELRREHGRDNVMSYFGETDIEERGIVRDRFQKEDLQFVVANKAAARGLTFTACDDNFIHSNSFDFGDRKQLEDRTHRIGTANSVLYTDCEAARTVDRKIINCLKKRQKIADLLRNTNTLFMEEAAI